MAKKIFVGRAGALRKFTNFFKLFQFKTLRSLDKGSMVGQRVKA